MEIIGRIDTEIFKVVSEHIRTDEVVLTDERIQHIKERHPGDYEKYAHYISTMLEHPQYILDDRVPATAVILQEFHEPEDHFRLVLKLAVVGDKAHRRNSVITFLKISEKKFKKYLANKKALYKSE